MTHVYKWIDVRYKYNNNDDDNNNISRISIDSSREWARCARQLYVTQIISQSAPQILTFEAQV